MNYVIAVAGPVGSGKSSLVSSIVKTVPDSSTLYFDHYEGITRKAPHEIVQWIQKGADIDFFAIPGLARDLEKLKRGEAVTDPLTHEVVEPRKYIVFEMPFGKAHAETAPFIDLLIWIDIPLDFALARKLREHAGIFLEEYPSEQHTDCLAWLHGFSDNYLSFVHQVLMIQNEKVRPGADLLLDGLIELESLSRKVSQFISTKLP